MVHGLKFEKFKCPKPRVLRKKEAYKLFGLKMFIIKFS